MVTKDLHSGTRQDHGRCGEEQIWRIGPPGEQVTSDCSAIRGLPEYVALDRDGTVIRHVHHLVKVQDVVLIEGAGTAISRLNGSGVPVFVITNQSVVGRGLLDAENLDRIHSRIQQLLQPFGAHIDAICYCPHRPDQGCRCRKPLPKMLLDVLGPRGLAARSGIVIGDSPSDVHLGLSVGARVIHVQSGVCKELPKTFRVESVPNLSHAVDSILGPASEVR